MARIRLTTGTEQDLARTPIASLLLASVAMVPTCLGAAASIVVPCDRQDGVERATITWAGAVLCFLAGVRRGLSFRQEGGSTAGEIGEMLVVFCAGTGALLLRRGRAPLAILLSGYGLTAVFDIRGARQGDAPRYFERLRPPQMILPTASLAILLIQSHRRKRSGRA